MNYRRLILPLLFVFLLTGCKNSSGVQSIQPQKDADHIDSSVLLGTEWRNSNYSLSISKDGTFVFSPIVSSYTHSSEGFIDNNKLIITKRINVSGSEAIVVGYTTIEFIGSKSIILVDDDSDMEYISGTFILTDYWDSLTEESKSGTSEKSE